jgi:hypothetical protein
MASYSSDWIHLISIGHQELCTKNHETGLLVTRASAIPQTLLSDTDSMSCELF